MSIAKNIAILMLTYKKQRKIKKKQDIIRKNKNTKINKQKNNKK